MDEVFIWSGVVAQCQDCGDAVELLIDELVDGAVPEGYECANCDRDA